MRLWNKIKKWLSALDQWNRQELTGLHERELMELENIFAVLNFGIVLGLPMPPLHITGELLPYLEDELLVLMDRMETSLDPVAELFSIFSID